MKNLKRIEVQEKECPEVLEGKGKIFHFTDDQIMRAEKITLPQGLHGLTQTNHFAYLEPEDAAFKPFKVLFNLDEPSISFITLAAEAFNGFGLSHQDKKDTAAFYNIAEESTKVLYLVRIIKKGDSFEMTANLRAPIIVDVQSKKAWQHILEHSEFQFDFPLNDIFSTLHKHKDD